MAHRRAIRGQRRRLEKEMAALIANDGRLATVKAPPGSGKTTLLLDLIEVAYRQGLRVAVGTQTNAQADDICARLARDHARLPAWRFTASGGAGGALSAVGSGSSPTSAGRLRINSTTAGSSSTRIAIPRLCTAPRQSPPSSQ